jgi:FkbM family methyltransferase
MVSHDLNLENSKKPLETYRLPNGMEIFHYDKFQTEALYQEIFAEESYYKFGVSLQDGDCVFDVGANIGMFSLFIISRFKNIQLYAFEPAPPTYEILAGNLAKYSNSAKAFNVGISDTEKLADFTFYPNLSCYSSFFEEPAKDTEILSAVIQNQLVDIGSEAQKKQIAEMFLKKSLKKQVFSCRLIPLSQMIQSQSIEKIHLLKIDVEKAEWEVLEGINAADWGKIQQVVMEIHDDRLLDKVTAKLKNIGYQVTVDIDKKFKDTSIYNLYAV